MAAILTFHPDSPVPTSRHATATSRRPGRASAAVYRRRRLAVAAVALGLVLGLMSWGRSADAARTPDADTAESISYVVQPGDTLWSIALELAPGEDPRPVVDALDDISGGALLQPGQRLAIPGDLAG